MKKVSCLKPQKHWCVFSLTNNLCLNMEPATASTLTREHFGPHKINMKLATATALLPACLTCDSWQKNEKPATHGFYCLLLMIQIMDPKWNSSPFPTLGISNHADSFCFYFPRFGQIGLNCHFITLHSASLIICSRS